MNAPWVDGHFSHATMALGNCVFAIAFYRRADWVDLGGYREALSHGYEDYDFWIRLTMGVAGRLLPLDRHVGGVIRFALRTIRRYRDKG